MKPFLFFCTLFIIAHLHLTFAQNLEEQSKDIKFQHFTSANGLSQRSVMAIHQDKKGYLWFGTRDGLNKFDGNKFIVYKHKPKDNNSLSNNNIHSIFEDTNGNLWVGTQNGLNKYVSKNDNFIQFKHQQKNSLTSNKIHHISQIDKDILWIATDDGISEVNTKTNLYIKKFRQEKKQLSDNRTRFILKNKDGNIWICNTKFIDVYNPKTNAFKKIDYPKSQNDNIHFNDLPTLYLDHKNNIWLGYEAGLAIYDVKQKSFVDYNFKDKKAITSALRSICEDLHGNLWFGTYSGLYILNNDHTELKHIVHNESDPTSLSQNSIYKIIKDNRGDIWLGTWADGLNYYNRDNGAFKKFTFGNTNNKLNYKVVSGIAEDLNGNLWIGTEGGGLNFYDKLNKKFTYYKNNPNDKNSISANNVKAVIIDKNHNIWIGIHDGGLNLLKPNNKPYQFLQIDFPKTNNISLKSYKVLSLLEDTNGNIWIGTLTGGLILYNTQAKTLTKLDKDIKAVMSIVKTENPDLLLIGGEKGLETININTFKREKIILKKDDASNIYINCLFVDNYNNYWAGTEGDGIYVYDPKRKKIKSYGIKDGLPNDIIYGILSDNNGNIWISSNNGLSRLNIESDVIKNYNYSDDLQGNEFNYGSFFKTKNKELFFGGTNGLTYFNPNDIRKNTFVPNIDINNIEVNNSPYSKITDSTKKITLKYNENNFSIDFTALSYMHPEKNEFKYILEGNDKKWIDAKSQRKAVYTNIKEGNYIFKVKGSNNDGVWNETYATLQIKVLPAPWHTWWAYLIYTGIIGGVLFYIRRLILLRIKERKEKEKSEEINQFKLRLFTEISHDFRTPLTLIIGPLEKMVKQNVGDSNIQQQHQIMLKNAKMLFQLIEQILDFRKSESKTITLQASELNISPFIEDIKKSFDLLASKKNINYQFHTSNNEIKVWFDEIKLKKVIFNLLSNAFKFTPDSSKINIDISEISKKTNYTTENFIKISIINFGDIIPENLSNFIFDQFYQIDNNKQDLGYGIGLALSKRLIELHKGEILVKSSEDTGTEFSILLRLGNKHLSTAEYLNHPIVLNDDNIYIPEEVIYKKDDITETNTNQINNLKNLLIIEDNIELQNFIKEIFIGKYNVFYAENGQNGFSIATENEIDLIISDINMPVMNGFELCKKIKTNLITSHIPIILLTAKTSVTHQEEGYSIGADSYITKPFNAKLLELKVDNLLETRAALIKKFKKDIILEPKKLTVTSPDEIFLSKAISIIENNINNQNFNASTLIDEMNMSRTVIYNKIKDLTGQNISTFIRTIRLKKAGHLILTTSMNISQIAYEVGFNDLKYFRECFKEFFKVTPTEYKKTKK